MKQNTIKVKEPAIFFRENSAEPEKRMHENLSKMQGQRKRKGVKKHWTSNNRIPFLEWTSASANRKD